MPAINSFYIVSLVAILTISIATPIQGKFTSRQTPSRQDLINYILSGTVTIFQTAPAEELQRFENAVDNCLAASASKRHFRREKFLFSRRDSSKTFQDYLKNFEDYLNTLSDEQLYGAAVITAYLLDASPAEQQQYIENSINTLNECGKQKRADKRQYFLRSLLEY